MSGSRPREKPETEVPLTDAAKARKAEQVADDAAAGGRRRPRPTPGGRVRNRRPSKAPKGQGGRAGTRATKKGVPGRTELTPSLRGAGRRLGGISKEELAEARAVKRLIGENAAAQRAAERLKLLECEALTKSIAEAHPKADELEHARDLLVAVAKLADDEIQGLGIVQRVLEEAGSGPRNWFDVFFDLGNTHTRSDLLRLVKRVDPVIETGFPELLARTLQGGQSSLGAGLGHLHAIAHLEEAYRAFGVVFRLEERAHIRQYARQGRKIVEADERALREIDIVAVLNDGRQIDIEVKTYTNGIEISQSVRYQIVKDLLEHLGGVAAETQDSEGFVEGPAVPVSGRPIRPGRTGRRQRSDIARVQELQGPAGPRCQEARQGPGGSCLGEPSRRRRYPHGGPLSVLDLLVNNAGTKLFDNWHLLGAMLRVSSVR